MLAGMFYTDGTAWCVSLTNAQGDKAVPEASSTPLPVVLRPVSAQRLLADLAMTMQVGGPSGRPPVVSPAAAAAWFTRS